MPLVAVFSPDIAQLVWVGSAIDARQACAHAARQAGIEVGAFFAADYTAPERKADAMGRMELTVYRVTSAETASADAKDPANLLGTWSAAYVDS